MARDFIKIDPSLSGATQANLLKQTVASMRSAYELLSRCLAEMNHNNDGTVFTDIETLFGLPSGKGQTVFNLVNGALGSTQATFQVADFKTMTEQVG